MKNKSLLVVVIEHFLLGQTLIILGFFDNLKIISVEKIRKPNSKLLQRLIWKFIIAEPVKLANLPVKYMKIIISNKPKMLIKNP